MLKYRCSTQVSADTASFPSDLPTSETDKFNDFAAGDTTTGESASDIRSPSFDSSKAGLSALAFDDAGEMTFLGYRFTCAISSFTQHILNPQNAVKLSQATVWAKGTGVWAEVEQYDVPETGHRTFSGIVPDGTQQIAVVLVSSIQAPPFTDDSGIGATYHASVSLTDFRLKVDCTPPPTPTFAGVALDRYGPPTIRLSGE